MKRLLIALLAALLLTSCGGGTATEDTIGTPSGGEGNAAAEEAVETEPETTVDDLFKIEQQDYEGKTFSLLTTETQQYEYDATELTGEVVNDAVYDRNLAVEELLGIKFNFVYRPGDWANKDSFCQIITNSIMAADGAYDVTSGMISCVQPIATSKLFMNVYDLEDINMDNPWWVTELQNGLTINGKLIGFIGDMSLSMYKGLSVMFANLNLMNDSGLPNPYELVLNNEWTLDKMIELSTGNCIDTNGDGQFKLGDDLYSLVIYEVPLRSIQASFDLPAISINEEGMPVVNSLTDEFASAVERMSALLATQGVAWQDNVVMNTYFASEQAFMLMSKLEALDQFRDMESDYAVLPFPKYDAFQEKYLTLIATATQMTYIPTTTPDPVLTGKVCEALSYYSYKDVVPAYYDVALKNKYSRDENTQKMLDIIRDGAVLPFEYAYSTMIGGNPWPNQLMSGTSEQGGDVASKLASVKPTWEAAIQKTLEAYE